MPIKMKACLLIPFLALFGCKSALLAMHEDNKRIEERIRAKEIERVNLENQNQQLSFEKNKLLSDLNQKDITLDELHDRVAKLKEANSQYKAVTEAERRKQAKLARSLDDYSRKINALDQDNSLGVAQKKKKIDELKQQIKEKVKRDSELFAD